jgi:hypothetical protein
MNGEPFTKEAARFDEAAYRTDPLLVPEQVLHVYEKCRS